MPHSATDDLLAEVPWLRRFAAGLVRSAAEADDLVQDTLSAALRAEAPPGPKRKLLGGIARNLARAARRGDRRRAEREARHAMDGRRAATPGADEDARRLDLLRVLLGELSELPPAQRRAITSRFLDEMEPAEIAARDGVSASSVRAQLARGLAALRERMDRNGDGRDQWLACLGPWALGGASVPPAVSTPDVHGPSGPGPDAALTSQAGSPFSFLLGLVAMKMTVLLATAVAIPLLIAGLWWSGGDLGPGTFQGVGDSPGGPPELETLATVDSSVDRRPAAPSAPASDLATPAVQVTESAVVSPGAPVIGLVTDMLTGEPVPEMGIEALAFPTQPSSGERFKSDAQGHIELDPSHFHGVNKLRLVERDGTVWGQKASARQSEVAFPFEGPIPVHVGPTFSVEVPEDLMEELWSVSIRFRAVDDAIPHNDPIASFRKGTTPWIRFPRAVTEMEGGPFELVFDDRRGLRTARVPVSRTRGIEPEILRPVFEPRGAVRFTLAIEGAAQAPAVKIDIEPVSHTIAPDIDLRGFLNDKAEDGTVSGTIRMLPPGQYAWSILGAGTGASGQFAVKASETTDVTLGLDALGATFDSEVLIDASEVPGAQVTNWLVMVSSEDEVGAGFMTRPVAVDGTPHQYRIPLKALSHGTWRVAVQIRGDESLEPGSAKVTPGAAPEVLRVRSGSGRAKLTLSFVDDGSGAAIQAVSAAVLIVPKESFEFTHADNELMRLTTDKMPLSGPVEVFVRAPGYQGAVLVHDASNDPAERVVRLTPGWRNRALVLDITTMKPAADVPVHMDGRLAGKTDASGWCWLEGEAPPLLVEVGRGQAKLDVVGTPYDGSVRGDTAIDPVHGFIFQVAPKGALDGR